AGVRPSLRPGRVDPSRRRGGGAGGSLGAGEQDQQVPAATRVQEVEAIHEAREDPGSEAVARLGGHPVLEGARDRRVEGEAPVDRSVDLEAGGPGLFLQLAARVVALVALPLL